MAYTDDWESLMNGVFGPGGRFKAAPGTSAPKTGGSAALPDLNAALLEQQKRLDELLKQQNAQLRTQSDATTAALESSRQMLRDMEDEGLLARGTTDVKPEHLGSFEGLAAEVKQTVLGQDAFVDSVVRAMRRPFVLGTEAPAARNVILLTGGAGTGRHFALEETARCMAARGLLQSDRIATLDLALYPNSGAEKLFLQDLYAALHAPGEILAFEHYESCYPGFLKTLSDLAVKGSAPLSSRYLVNKEGILVDAGTALAPGAVSRIDPCGKYLIFYSHKGREALADKFGAALVSALGDVCETASYTREDLAALAAQQLNALAQKIRTRLGLTLSAGADVRDYVAAQCTAQKGAAGLSACTDRIFRALSEYCLRTDETLTGTVTLTAADGSTTTCPAVDFSSVGVAAVDEHTLTYTLNYDFPGFLSLLNYAPFEPAYGPMLAELGDQFCTSAETACNCGAFYLAEYTPLESWVMKKSPENYDKDNVYIDTVRYIYNQEALISGPEMVRRGEIDQATISSDILDSWLADDTTKDMVSMERPETGKSYFYFFNFLPYAHSFSNWNTTGVDAQYQPDNWAKAITSTNFRKAFLYAINPAVTLAVTAPEGYENYKLHTITPPSFCADSKGVDYTECGALAKVTDHFNEATAKQYRDAAVQELTAAGATFPIKVQYPYNPAVVDWDKQCQVFKQQIEGVLNDGFDFVDIIITQGPSDNFLNAVRRAGAYEFMSYYWGADYSDPETEVYPFYQEAGDRGTCYAFLRTGVEDGIITGETADYVMTYMDMVEKAKAITADLDARYAAFADAEAYLIENALVIPLSLPVPPYIATRLNLWEGQYAPTGFSSNRLKGIHILDHYVSMDEYNRNRDAR